MTRFDNPLDNIRIAAPCKADWEQMIGNDRARFCGQCNLNVYNLSGMTRSQAEHVIANNEGRLCVRFYRRADGSILTKNCPVGLRAIKRKLSYVSRAITSALLTFFAGVGVYQGLSGFSISDRFARRELMGQMVSPPGEVMGETVGPPEVPYPPVASMGGVPIMGKMRIQKKVSRFTR